MDNGTDVKILKCIELGAVFRGGSVAVSAAKGAMVRVTVANGDVNDGGGRLHGAYS